MSLSNTEYQNIIREYEKIQTKNRHILNARYDEIYSKIPSYKDLEDAVSSISIQKGRDLLNGDIDSLDTLRSILSDIKLQKESLLLTHNYPVDYLEPIYNCSLCKDTGYVNNQKCKCFKKQEIDLLYKQTLLPELFKDNNFSLLSEEFYSGSELVSFQNAVKTSKNFINSFSKDYQNIFYYGTVGTGKSFLACCVAKELLDMGYSVLYFSAVTLFGLISSYTFDINTKNDLNELLQEVNNCDLLIIDDLGTELKNKHLNSQIFSIINERHLRKKSIIITSNLTLEGLQAEYSDRIFTRITSYFELLKLQCNDIRIQIKLTNKRK